MFIPKHLLHDRETMSSVRSYLQICKHLCVSRFNHEYHMELKLCIYGRAVAPGTQKTCNWNRIQLNQKCGESNAFWQFLILLVSWRVCLNWKNGSKFRCYESDFRCYVLTGPCLKLATFQSRVWILCILESKIFWCQLPEVRRSQPKSATHVREKCFFIWSELPSLTTTLILVTVYFCKFSLLMQYSHWGHN